MYVIMCIIQLCVQAMLRKPDVLKQVQLGHKSTGKVLRDFCDGKWVAAHRLFQSNPESLMLVFYYDLEMANPLDSKRGKHKLGTVLFRLVVHFRQFRAGTPIRCT